MTIKTSWSDLQNRLSSDDKFKILVSIITDLIKNKQYTLNDLLDAARISTYHAIKEVQSNQKLIQRI